MSPDSQELLVRLRHDFDSSFAEPVEAGPDDRVDLLAIEAGDHDLALRVDELAAIQRCPTLVALPNRQPALAGVAGVRGSVVAVYDIASLLGDGPNSAAGGWIVVCAVDRSVALRFDRLAGYESATADAVAAAGSASPETPADGVVRLRGVHRSLLSIPRTVEELKRNAKPGGVTEPTNGQPTEPD